MSQAHPVRGRCLCGTVSLRAVAGQAHVDACHCSMCRTWGGGPLLAVECQDIEIDGEEAVTVFNSSEWAERGFCSRCGTHLFYRLKDGGVTAVPAGLLSDSADWHFTQQIFVDEKPSYYDFANDTRKLTGAEVFAQFGAAAD